MPRKLLLLAVGFAAVLAPVDSHSDTPVLELIGRWPVGPIRGMTVDDGRVFVGYGAALEILDASDPTRHDVVNRTILDGPILAVAVIGEYAYVARGSFLDLIDISDPTDPNVVATLPTPADDIIVIGDIAFVSTNDERKLHLLDISDPANPVETAVIEEGLNRIRDVSAIDDSHVFVTTSAALKVFDVADPSNPMEVESNEVAKNLRAAAVFHNPSRSVLSEYAVAVGGALSVYHFDEDYALRWSTSLSGYGYAYDLFTIDNIVYIASGGVLYIVDFSESPPTVRGSATYDLDAGKSFQVSLDFAVDGNLAYVYGGGSNEFVAIDISNPDRPRRVYEYERSMPGGSWGAGVAGDYLYVGTGGFGLRVLDVSDPGSPVEVGHADLMGYSNSTSTVIVPPREESEGPPNYVFAYGDRLNVFDVSTPQSPVFVAGYVPPDEECEPDWDPPDCSNSVSTAKLGGNYLYVGGVSTFTGLGVINVSDPTNPFGGGAGRLGCWDGAVDHLGGVYAIALAGDLVAAYQRCFLVDPEARTLYTIDPRTPGYVGSLELGEDVAEMFGVPGHVYASLWSGELIVVDVADPGAPAVVGGLQLPRHALDIAAVDQYLVLTEGGSGVRILDVGDPGDPREVAVYDTGDAAVRLAVRDNQVFVTDRYDGVYVFEFTSPSGQPPPLPTATVLDQNSPNPFNPGTNIHFELAVSGRVRLDVFSVDGRLVRSLVSQSLPAGDYDFPWDGRDANGDPVGSGVYFYRLVTPQQTLAKKMVLVR